MCGSAVVAGAAGVASAQDTRTPPVRPEVAVNAAPALPAIPLEKPIAQESLAQAPLLKESLASGFPVKQPDYVPLDLKQKFSYSATRVAGPSHMLWILTRSAMDQKQKRPAEWDTGMDAYGVRVASRFGRSLVRESVAFGVRAIDHEDPRYFRSQDSGVWKRTRYAVSRTFVVRNDNGGWMPAYSRFVSDYSMPFIAQLWRPEPFRASREFRSGTVALGLNMLANVGQEFWPDVRKRIPFMQRRFERNQGLALRERVTPVVPAAIVTTGPQP